MSRCLCTLADALWRMSEVEKGFCDHSPVWSILRMLTHCDVPGCSVDLPSYVAGSWLGMLPGTIAYVYAGNYGRALIDGDGDVGGVKGGQVALGLGITILAIGYIGKLAKKALDDVEEEGTTKSP